MLSALSALALLLCPAGSLRAAGDTGQVDLPTVLEMVETGVGDAIILKQVAAAGPSFDVGIPEVLALKRAGASDALIDGLMELAGILPGPERASSAQAGPAGPSSLVDPPENFRISRERDGEGREIIHITNLDASGRRLGGPPPPDDPPAPRNAYVSRSGEEWVRDSDATYEPAGSGPREGGVPQVVVNVFQPDDEPVAILDDHDRYGDRYGRRYAAAGYLPVGYGRRACRHGYIFGVPSPPGSYSHFKLHHSRGTVGHTGLYNGGLAFHRARQHGFVQPLTGHGLPVPFQTAGAANLNRMRAGVKLGH